MPNITERQILSLATNAAAVANAKKISQKGGFVRRYAAADGSFYGGDCKGSGKQPYQTSVDFSDPAQPVFRCSCPSRQFPCKHGLALLYEMMADKPFQPLDEVPAEIREKRARRQARAEKAAQTAARKSDQADAQDAAQTMQQPPPAGQVSAAAPAVETAAAPSAPAARPAPKRSAAANTARGKKLAAQLEGLHLAETLLRDLIAMGLGSVEETQLADYRQLARQLGDYYLPGPQLMLHRFLRELEAFQQDGADARRAAALELVRQLWALTQKGQTYLRQKLESGQVAPDTDPLYAALGGVWKLSELEGLGQSRPGARLMQLGFWSGFDEAAQTWTDTGVWADLAGGPLLLTQNLRPVKALKHLRADDSVFELLQVPAAVLYPGEGNRRVRWESAEPCPLAPVHRAAVLAQAQPLAPLVKQAKNLLKNTLAAPVWFALVRYERIGQTAQGLALQDGAGGSILLGDAPGLPPTAYSLGLLPDAALLQGQVLLAGFFYDAAARRLLAQPISILTADRTVRLLY